MPTRHTISYADKLYAGDAYHPGYAKDHGERRSIELSHIKVTNYGAIATLQAAGLINAATSTELPNTETVTYTAATDGTSPLDHASNAATATIVVNGQSYLVYDLATPRNITSTTTHGSSVVAMTITITGWDEYLQPMTETLSVAATGTSQAANGAKAWRYVYSIAITAAADAEANTLNLGFGDAIGLPFRSDRKGGFLVFVDGNIDAATKVVAVTTDPATATTGDVRGTWDSSSAPDGTKVYVVWQWIEDHSSTTAVFGVTQA